MRKNVFVALSGGVDSSVAAALLKERGFDVIGIHMAMWQEPGLACSAAADRQDAARVAAHLGIPFRTWDFTEEYRSEVVDYLLREYASGRTPNPDVMCNRKIKFGAFLRKALESGADYIATGHYARNVESSDGQTRELHIAQDSNKDQSYFLWTLTQDELKRTLFPLENLTKPEVRSIARRLGLPTAEKPDSQGICFIGDIDVRKFLRRRLPERPGFVLTTSGRVVGEHAGAQFYTIGQRHGLGIGGGKAHYVAERLLPINTLVVAEGPDDPALYRSEIAAGDVNWISGSPPEFPLRCWARIRYRQPLQECEVTTSPVTKRTISDSMTNDFLLVRFDAPMRAVAPGQSVVLYDAEMLLGGGVIA